MAASILYTCSHCILQFLDDIDPTVPLILLGFAYVFILSFWPIIAIIVPDPEISPTAIGLATCIQNAALTVSPLIIAGFSKFSTGYYWEEVFFIVCSILSVILVSCLYYFNGNGGGLLNSK
jgi:hypothetical protein